MGHEGGVKADLRATVQRMRGRADVATLAAASARATELLAGLQGLQRARTVLVHVPRPGDLDPTGLVARLADRGVRVVVADRHARDHEVAAPGPARLAGAEHPVDVLAEVEAVVLPGVAFDLDGGWLADDRGNWERLLVRLDDGVLRVGLARTTQLVPRVPREPHDLVVDVVVTDRAVHHTGARAGPRDA